jgi:effector-binding domain-containing protein
MANSKRCFFASILIFVIVTCLVAGAAKDEGKKDEVKLKNYKSKLVLYTVCRGGNKKVGLAARDLYFLAENKIIRLLSTYVYLNDREEVPSKHWLTEIRLDARSDAIEHAGKLGEWVDIKEIPAYQAVAAIKNQGVADSGPIYEKLYSWIFEHGYVPAGRPIENLLLGTTNAKYEKIKSEITIPVKKLSAVTKEGDN